MEPDDPEAYEKALRRLPCTYALALRLEAAAVGGDEMCDYLDIEPEGLASLLEIAHRKLHSEIRSCADGTCPDDPPIV